MVIPIFFAIHWYVSLFFQSVFHHRYSAHRLFTMSMRMEKFFQICCFVTQGSSFISSYSYGIMHRLHHAETDTENDPHSPENSKNVFVMMWDTRCSYFDIYSGKTKVDEKYKKDLPRWEAFDKFAHNWITRICWIAAYTTFYIVFATAWWQYLFLPGTIIMGSLQGAVVNWWAHRFGYKNFKLKNLSRNIVPVDLFFWGESFHNNHHHNPGRANNAIKWYEFDAGYFVLKGMDKVGLIQLKN